MIKADLNRNDGALLIRVLLIAGATLWIYAQAFHGPWIWDDTVYLEQHLHLADPAGWWKTWLRPAGGDYYPIESTVLFIQWRLWHNATLGYHLTNVTLHIVSALLVWRLLGRMGVPRAWLGGLIFAVHPIMVESVAWIVELKNTLSLPPLLLAMCAYLDFDEKRRSHDYYRALGFFLLAMLCKTSVMMFPAVILLYSWWRRGRIGLNDIKASAPFFAVTVLLGLVEAVLQHQNGPLSAMPGGVLPRLATVGWVIPFYLAKCLFPAGLLPLYPSRLVISPSLFDLLPWLPLAAVIGIPWLGRNRWGQSVLLGVGFFLLNLMPVMGFILMNAPTMAWSMDHLVYVPVIGLIGLVVAGCGYLETRLPGWARYSGIGVTTIAVTLLALESHGYANLFSNEEAFWNYTLLHNPKSPLAHNDLGSLFVNEKRMPEAIAQYEQAIAIDPAWVEARNNLGSVLEAEGQLSQAEAQFEAVLKIDPRNVSAHGNLAWALSKTGRMPEAIEQAKMAIGLNPDDAALHRNLGDLFAQSGRFPEAAEQYELALKINPGLAEAEFNLAGALARMGQPAGALEHAERAVQIKPDFADARFNLGNALAQSGRIPEAVDQYRAVLQINPNYAGAHANLGTALLQLGQVPDALAQYREALRLNPRDVKVRTILGLVLAKTGHFPEAATQFEAVLKIDPRNATAKENLEKIKNPAAAGH